MILQEIAPLMLYLNLAKREDRRKLCKAEFTKHGLSVERHPAIPETWVRSSRGHADQASYVAGLNFRLAIREAKRRGAPAVALFADNVMLHDYFRSRLDEMELPDDWQVFYLSGSPKEGAEPVSQGLVRANQTADSRAVVIRDTAFDRVQAALKPSGKKGAAGSIVSIIEALAGLDGKIACYAAEPILAWQRPGS